VCSGHLKLISGVEKACLQFVVPELVIGKGKLFYLSARSELTRDILFIPSVHINNLALATDPTWWQLMLDAKLFLEKEIVGPPAHFGVVDRVSLNFGQWETKIAQNPRLLDCHGHAHFALKAGTCNLVPCGITVALESDCACRVL